jgi:hypothetical protein
MTAGMLDQASDARCTREPAKLDFSQGDNLIIIKRPGERAIRIQKKARASVSKKSHEAKFGLGQPHLISVNCALVQIG